MVCPLSAGAPPPTRTVTPLATEPAQLGALQGDGAIVGEGEGAAGFSAWLWARTWTAREAELTEVLVALARVLSLAVSPQTPLPSSEELFSKKRQVTSDPALQQQWWRRCQLSSPSLSPGPLGSELHFRQTPFATEHPSGAV